MTISFSDVAPVISIPAPPAPGATNIGYLNFKTSGGISHSINGDCRDLVFLLSASIGNNPPDGKESAFYTGNSNLVSMLKNAGFGVVSLDMPSHGQDGGNAGLSGWVTRLRDNEDIFGAFSTKISAIIDFIQPRFCALVGVSRGAYCGLIAAASDSRITHVCALAPALDLRKLTEFKGAGIGSDLSAYYTQLAAKKLYTAVNDHDPRIGPDAVDAFNQAMVTAGADITFTIAQGAVHGVSETVNSIALQWLCYQRTQANLVIDTYHQVEVVPNGTIQIRFMKKTVGGSDAGYHRTSIKKNGDIDAQMTLVNAHLTAMGMQTISSWQRITDVATAAWAS